MTEGFSVAGLVVLVVLNAVELLDVAELGGERDFDTGFLVVFTFVGLFLVVVSLSLEAGTDFWDDRSEAAAEVVFVPGLASGSLDDDSVPEERTALSVFDGGVESFCGVFPSAGVFAEFMTFAICSTAFGDGCKRSPNGEEAERSWFTLAPSAD